MQRSTGHRQRFERVARCEQDHKIDIQCTYCGRGQSRAARCRTALACVSCRGKIAEEKRAKLMANRRTAIDLAAKRGLFRRLRHGGAWSEKLVTLSVPHFPELGIVPRIAFLRATWKGFVRRWQRWLRREYFVTVRDPVTGKKRKEKRFRPDNFKDDRGHSLIRWFRNVEWTAAEDWVDSEGRVHAGDHKGHPHIHLWFLGPYLPGAKKEEALARKNVVQNLWSDALREAALKVPELTRLVPDYERSTRKVTRVERILKDHVARACYAPIVDVRKVAPGPKSVSEVIKYLFKDFAPHGGRLDPRIWAQVYEGFDGARSTQGSRGLATLAVAGSVFKVDVTTGELREGTPAECAAKRCACGQRGYWRVHRRPMTAEEAAQLLAARRARADVRKARDRRYADERQRTLA
jgi:hypothetical protein